MTLEKALETLKQVRITCSASQLEEIDFTIKILEKLSEAGIKEPLHADFKKLA